MYDLTGKHGLAKLNCVNGSLYIRLPLSVSPGKHSKRIALGLKAYDKAQKRIERNWDKAERILTEINNDIFDDRFDATLEKYLPSSKKTASASAKHKALVLPTLKEIYQAYIDSRWDRSRPGTKREYQRIKRLTEKCPHQDILKVLPIVDWVRSRHSSDLLRRFLLHINAAYSYAQSIDLISLERNPWLKSKKLETSRRQSKSKSTAIALTQEQQSQIIEAFKTHKYYSHYWQYVAFCFQTGVRPEEALPLYWSDFSEDFSKVILSRVWTEGKDGRSGVYELVEGLKTQDARILNLTEEAQTLLKEYSRNKRHPKYVFPSPKGLLINPSNFSRRAWKRVVHQQLGFKAEFTPRRTRHTFITDKARKNISSTQVAAYVGNSAATIDKHYNALKSEELDVSNW